MVRTNSSAALCFATSAGMARAPDSEGCAELDTRPSRRSFCAFAACTLSTNSWTAGKVGPSGFDRDRRRGGVSVLHHHPILKFRNHFNVPTSSLEHIVWMAKVKPVPSRDTPGNFT